MTIFRIFVTYKAFAFFFVSGSLIFLCGVLIGVRFLYFFFSPDYARDLNPSEVLAQKKGRSSLI